MTVYAASPNNFRGQSSKFETVNSSICRDRGHMSNEYNMYSDAVRMKVDEFGNLNTAIECLAKMQHYGKYIIFLV